jgi:phosphoglycolate phosphatase-like HAD superfamily hydrolase
MNSFTEIMLVIFDYSGTLSLEAPRFGRSENLMRALKESGLFALGVKTPDIFWGKIINPTWVAGSTTALGYKRVMAERIGELNLSPGAAMADITMAASRFVDRYLEHSRIDPLWRPLLANLSGSPGTAVVIATDHYAEATESIIHHLKLWGIPARRVGEKAGPRFPIFIANSADIGFWKADSRFWKVLKSRFEPETVRSVLIVDDFGFNEQKGDRYGEQAKIKARQGQTITVLGEVFQAGIEVIPFFLKDDETGDATARRIAETGELIGRFLNPPADARPAT